MLHLDGFRMLISHAMQFAPAFLLLTLLALTKLATC